MLKLTVELNRMISWAYAVSVPVFMLWMLVVVIKNRGSSFRMGSILGTVILCLDVASAGLLFTAANSVPLNSLNDVQMQVVFSSVGLAFFSLSLQLVVAGNWFLAVHLGEALGVQTVEVVAQLKKWATVFLICTVGSIAGAIPIPILGPLIYFVCAIGAFISFILCLVKLANLRGIAQTIGSNNPVSSKGISTIFLLAILSLLVNVISIVVVVFVTVQAVLAWVNQVSNDLNAGRKPNIEDFHSNGFFLGVVVVTVIGALLPRILAMISFSQSRANGALISAGSEYQGQSTTGFA